MTGASDFTLVVPFRVDAVVNGASFVGSPCPGSIAAIFGVNLAAELGGVVSVPLPLSIGSTKVLINGITAPLWYVSPGQINFQMPFETSPGPATVVVNAGGGFAPVFSFNVPPAAPGILTYGDNRAVADNTNGSLTDANHPAAPGSVITVYMTGLGTLDNPVETNSVSPGNPLSRPTLSVSASIGGQTAQVQFIGLTPGSLGLAQANVVVPSISAGDYPLMIVIGGVNSNMPLVSISQ